MRSETNFTFRKFIELSPKFIRIFPKFAQFSWDRIFFKKNPKTLAEACSKVTGSTGGWRGGNSHGAGEGAGRRHFDLDECGAMCRRLRANVEGGCRSHRGSRRWRRCRRLGIERGPGDGGDIVVVLRLSVTRSSMGGWVHQGSLWPGDETKGAAAPDLWIMRGGRRDESGDEREDGGHTLSGWLEFNGSMAWLY
jgi:hypothetical protein